jgi:hypothetical protein
MAVPAAAQKTGTRLDRNAGAVGSISGTDPRTAVRATNTFSQCVAKREGKRMRVALDLPFASPEQSKAMAKARDQFDGCLGDSADFDQLRSGILLMAGGSAEWFVHTDLKRVDLSPLNGMTDEVLAKAAYHPRNAYEDLGLCILRRSPEHARALLATDPTSDAELAAFKVISPDIGPCVDQGATLTLNRANVRAVLAYAMYRAASLMGVPGA